jgi:N,N-dimethylformamidase
MVGSYIEAPAHRYVTPERDFTCHVWFFPTLLSGKRQSIIATGREGRGFSLELDPAGHLMSNIGLGDGRYEQCRTACPLERHHWYFAAVRVRRDIGEMELLVGERGMWARSTPERVMAPLRSRGSSTDGSALLIAAAERRESRGVRPYDLFDGKIANPALWAGALSDAELAGLLEGTPCARIRPEDLIAAWDFSSDPSATRVCDRGPRQLHATTRNMPLRAATGPLWNGEHLDPRLAPHQFNAIHFHSDDLDDARWKRSFSARIPGSWHSGIYAFRLTSETEREYVPFVVRPARSALRTERIAVMLPTFTYLAYAGHHYDDPFVDTLLSESGRSATPDPTISYIRAHPELGMSLYDVHADGSSSTYSSHLRPMLEMRPDYENGVYGFNRHFSADLHLVQFLERNGFSYDVLTDHDLHREGATLLRHFDVVLTGHHPEYCSERMLSGIEEFVGSGGRCMYLGGNGFYWVTSLEPHRAHAIEVRRGFAGHRFGRQDPGEQHHVFTGELGGLWRHRGRAPQQLFGVGFAAVGMGEGAPYRTVGAVDGSPGASWLVAGVDSDRLGAEGPMGGVAGDEVDRMDHTLGTPLHAVRVATSEGLHNDSYEIALEDRSNVGCDPRGAQNPSVRGDVILLENDRGGAVFSCGSTLWVLGLTERDGDNDVARITKNVLERFLQPNTILDSDRRSEPTS